MTQRQHHGLTPQSRALLIVIGGLVLAVLAEVTIGVAYDSWWSQAFRGFLVVECLSLVSWSLADPRRFDAFTVGIGRGVRAVCHAVIRWGRIDFGGVLPDPPNVEDANVPQTPRLRPLYYLAEWYDRPPLGKQHRPLQWAFVWLCTLTSLYSSSSLILGTGGGIASPFIQYPLLVLVIAGMLSDRPWNMLLITGIGGVYSYLLVYHADSSIFLHPLDVSASADQSDRRLAAIIVTTTVLALGVSLAYLSTAYRRQKPVRDDIKGSSDADSKE